MIERSEMGMKNEFNLRAATYRGEQIEELRKVLREGVDVIEGDLTGPEWKKACREFCNNARALL